ncbi:hypothetical protein BC835DRAFT_1297911 [Cytidiella melzeri]|nr:hypothetical protein BC835DRAFT_1297911 [Cytidiella melzeri]
MTTLTTLQKLARSSADHLIKLGLSDSCSLKLVSDNVQQYVLQRERRVGRENVIKVGMSAFVTEVVDCDPSVLDVDDKLHRIRTSQRTELTVEKLIDFMDFDHSERIGVLQWLQVLVNYIPQLESMKAEVALLFRTKGAKIPLPHTRKTTIYPLSTVAKNENITSEFCDALLDFLAQIGQTPESYKRRLVWSGGDGLTFEWHMQIKVYMRGESNPVEAFTLLEPYPESWHTGATHLNLIYKTHWGSLLTDDPSKLGHSAAKINQKGPQNVKKVNYYPSLYTVLVVVDVCMLDCWRILLGADVIFKYFDDLEEMCTLPTLATLKEHVKTLFFRYSTQKGYNNAQTGRVPTEGPFAFAEGRAWTPPILDRSSLPTTAAEAEIGQPKYGGDQCLANSIMFIHNALLCREFSQSVAEGDPGRLYECIKCMCFSFAGSSHGKYMGYMLEMITNLELQLSPALKDAFLRNILINPSGKAGRYMEGDLYLEHLNLELEDMIKKKSAEWDSPHLRNVIAPNTAHFVTLKNSLHEGIGLAKMRGCHTVPHSRPEVKTLLKTYAKYNLHRLRPGRHYRDIKSDLNTIGKGVKVLMEGKLKKWISESTRMCYVAPTATIEEALHAIDTELAAQRDIDGSNTQQPTPGIVSYRDGELIVDVGAEDMVNEEFIWEGEEEMAAWSNENLENEWSLTEHADGADEMDNQADGVDNDGH